MSKKQIIQFSIAGIFICIGIYFSNFWGGMLTGISSTVLFFAFVGRYVANKAAERIDKRIIDIQNQILNDGTETTEDSQQQ